jgi:hypothetical protein
MKRIWMLAVVGFICSPLSVAAAKKPIVAVFGIENRGTSLTPEIVDRLTIYLASKLTESGAYEVVPQDKLKDALSTKKKDSFKACYAQSCQIEVGQELAANRALSTQLMKVGKTCLVTLNLYDLRTSTAARAATGRGGCDEEGIMGSIDGAFAKLAAATPAVTATPTPTPTPAQPPVARPIANAVSEPPPSSPPPRPPAYKTWWFWTLTLAAVVAITVGVVVSVSVSSTSAGSSGTPLTVSPAVLRF